MQLGQGQDRILPRPSQRWHGTRQKTLGPLKRRQDSIRFHLTLVALGIITKIVENVIAVLVRVEALAHRFSLTPVEHERVVDTIVVCVRSIIAGSIFTDTILHKRIELVAIITLTVL